MKKQKHTLFVLSASLIGSLLMLAGCGGSDDSSTADSSTAVPTAVPESLAGTTLTFNPSISFTTETFDYVNTAPTNTGLPTEAATGTTDSQKSEDSLVITMTPDSGFWDGKPMELTLSEFMDHQNDGIIDSYFCEFVWGDVKGSADGSFDGDGPENPDYEGVVDNGDKGVVDNGDKGVVADNSGAPTVEEWNQYIVGRWILDTEDGDEDGASYAGEIVSATQITESETETEGELTFVEDTTIEYEYEWVDEMTGKITYTSTSLETVISSFGEDRYVYIEKGVITLKFTDFFNATYSNEYEETLAIKNGVPYVDYPLESGIDTGTVELVESGPAD